MGLAAFWNQAPGVGFRRCCKEVREDGIPKE
jgi:hypothetical protein